jgi:hypothetical protein
LKELSVVEYFLHFIKPGGSENACKSRGILSIRAAALPEILRRIGLNI